MSYPSIEAALEGYLALRKCGADPGIQAFAAANAGLGRDLLEALEALDWLGQLGRQELTPKPLELQQECIGPFRLIRELGRGGMGVVYEAIEEPLGRRVALKVIQAELLRSQSMIPRFRREAALTSRLEHPGICQVYSADLDAAEPWIAMRYLEGESLATLIRQARNRADGLDIAGVPVTGRRRWLKLAQFMASAARALEAAHAEGVLHRDLKPSNVMVLANGEPVLLDFGLAREEGEAASVLTDPGHTAGTPAYLAPELIAGEVKGADVRTDIYSFGVMLYELLALRRPYESSTLQATYRAVLAGNAPRLRSLVPELPTDLAAVVHTSLERDRQRRYSSARALAEDLEAVSAGRAIRARPISLVGKGLRWARREPRLAVLATILTACAAGLAVAIGFLWASRDRLRVAELAARDSEVEDALHVGFQALREDRHDDANEGFEHALDLHPGLTEAHIGQMLVRLDQGRNDLVAELTKRWPHLQRLDALGQLDPDLRSPAAMAWFREATALELFMRGLQLERLIDRHPPSERAALARQAWRYFQACVQRAPRARALYHTYLVQACALMGDIEATRSAAQAMVALWPTSARELYTAGIALLELDPPESVRLLESAASVAPDEGIVHFGLGSACLMNGDAEAGEQSIRQAISLGVDGPDVRNMLALALVDLQRHDEARAEFTQIIAAAPNLLAAYSNLADLEFELGNYEAAATQLHRALELDPGDYANQHDLATAYYWLAEYEQALAGYEQLVHEHPEFADGWSGLIWTLHSQNDLEGARGVLGEALSLHPEAPSLLALRDVLK